MRVSISASKSVPNRRNGISALQNAMELDDSQYLPRDIFSFAYFDLFHVAIQAIPLVPVTFSRGFQGISAFVP
jgi:hypothetical protein